VTETLNLLKLLFTFLLNIILATL